VIINAYKGSKMNPSGITKETHFQKEMGFLFLMTFKMHFDKLEKIKNQKTALQFGFYAWIEPKKNGSWNTPSGITKETHFQKEMGFLFLMTFKIHFIS